MYTSLTCEQSLLAPHQSFSIGYVDQVTSDKHDVERTSHIRLRSHSSRQKNDGADKDERSICIPVCSVKVKAPYGPSVAGTCCGREMGGGALERTIGRPVPAFCLFVFMSGSSDWPASFAAKPNYHFERDNLHPVCRSCIRSDLMPWSFPVLSVRRFPWEHLSWSSNGRRWGDACVQEESMRSMHHSKGQMLVHWARSL